MKFSRKILSISRVHAFLLSVLLHTVVLSTPIPMIKSLEPQEMELFIMIEEIQIPPQPMKRKNESQKPRSEPVKQIFFPFEVPRPQMKEPEIVKSVMEECTEPIREINKSQGEIAEIEPVKEVQKIQPENIGEKFVKLESGHIDQPTPMVESQKIIFVPPVSSIVEKIDKLCAKGERTELKSDGEDQPLENSKVAKIESSDPIETRFGESIAPAFLHRELPQYPLIARRLGKEGKVVLRLTIDENGNLLSVDVVEKAGYGFTEAAVEAVKKSTFLPARRDGKPVVSRALLTIRFLLERN